MHYRDHKKLNTTKGDLLFTHDGLSGPGILDYSRYLQKGDYLKLNLVDFKNIELFDQELYPIKLYHGRLTRAGGRRVLAARWRPG